MLELITDTGNEPIHDNETCYAITHKWNGVNTLHFEMQLDDPMYQKLACEALIYETTEGQTYVVRGIDAGGQTLADIDCELDLGDWRESVRLSYYNNTSAISTTMSEIAPAGWSMAYDMASSQRRSVNLEYGGTPLDIAMEAQNSYSCAMQFDTKNKVCRVYYPQASPVSDVVITEGAMRRRPAYTGTSTELVTRIYPVGADGLTIEKVNGGKQYVENHSYTGRVISQVWKDERYENAQELKKDAQALVDSLAVPAASWEVPLVDLYRADPEQWPDHRVELYQKVQVQYGEKAVMAMVSEETVYPYHPERNEICVGTVAANAIHTLSGLAESVNNPNSAYNSKRDAAIANATKLIVGSSGGHAITVLGPDGKPMEFCVLTDTDDIATAQSLWRWNEGGLGHSSTGYNGEYSLALTKDGAIVANRITVGKIDTKVLDVEDIFAKNITARGNIDFANDWYRLYWDEDQGALILKTSWQGHDKDLRLEGSDIYIQSNDTDSRITILATWLLQIISAHVLELSSARDLVFDVPGLDSDTTNIIFNLLSDYKNSNAVSNILIRDNRDDTKCRKIIFSDDGTVRWVYTTRDSEWEPTEY